MTEEEIFIESFTKRGDGTGFISLEKGPPVRVEIPHTFPQDRVLAELRKKRRRMIKGRVIKILSPSPYRITPPCEHASICGGCSWQALAYAEQIKTKEKILQQIFAEFLPETTLLPMIPCDSPFCYRNKMEFSFSQNRGGTRYLGLMIARADRYVFNIAHCHLASPWFSDLLCALRKWWETSSLAAYNPLENQGILRTLTLREGKNTQEKMVVLTVAHSIRQEDIESFVSTVVQASQDPSISIFLRIQHSEEGKKTFFEEIHLHGPKSIKEKVFDLVFTISPSSFFQPNTHQAEKIFLKALEMVQPSPSDLLYDLYCGSGAFGLIFAPHVNQVIGIEENPEAIKDGKENIVLNRIKNCILHQGDVGKILHLRKEKPDIVIVDPPRIGLDQDTIDQILILRPKTLLYISCNPLTQVENIRQLKHVYRLLQLQPVDQFPHTPHIENIALLKTDLTCFS